MNNFVNPSYEDLSSKSLDFFNAKPFPFIILDNFLNDDFYEFVVRDLEHQKTLTMGRSFNSSLEKEKSISLNTGLPQSLKDLVDYLNNDSWVKNLSNLSRIRDLVGTKNGNTKLANYHEMRHSGFLGSHVDHASEPLLGLPHVLNIILYLSEDWLPEYGGETVLFDRKGKKELAKVCYKPNRAIIFLHTPYSFHGVSEISDYASVTRQTLYVDYYSRTFNPYIDMKLPFPNKWFDHPTTFVFKNKFHYFLPKNWLYLKLLAKYKINNVMSLFKTY
jgi:Rps23 Pro-64 3,4-dihydroxylase Tpa1-like proline 4-hydroxylase